MLKASSCRINNGLTQFNKQGINQAFLSFNRGCRWPRKIDKDIQQEKSPDMALSQEQIKTVVDGCIHNNQNALSLIYGLDGGLFFVSGFMSALISDFLQVPWRQKIPEIRWRW